MELSCRSAYRGQVTKIVKSATEYLNSPESQLKEEDKFDGIEEELNFYIQRLTAAHESLLASNAEVRSKSLIKEEDLDRDLEKVAEYQDSAIGTLAKLSTRMAKLRQKQTPRAVYQNESSLNTSGVVHSSVKLPVLTLKKFDGNFQEWLPFWDQFRTKVHENAGLTSSDKFSYLESVLVGNAKKVIEGFSATEMCYDAAVSLLKEQFGDTERLVDKHMQQLIALQPVVSPTDVLGLRHLYNCVTACSRTLTALQIPSHQYYVMLKSILLRCLPVDLRVDYHRSVERDNDLDEQDGSEQSSSSALSQMGDKQVQGIMRFLKREVESLERSSVVSVSANAKKNQSPTTATATSLVSLNEKEQCLFCASNNHSTRDCDSHISLAEKRDLLRKNNRCFRCTKRGHSSRKCRSSKWISCKKCKGNHSTSMCDPSYVKTKVIAATAVNTTNCENKSAMNLCANSVLENSNVFLKTARGIAAAPSKDKSILIRFIIDGGSQHTYIRESLVRKLNLISIGKVRISVIPFGSKEQCPFQILDKVRVAILSQFNNKSAYIEVVVPEICVDVLPAPESSCHSFQGIQLADTQHESMGPIEVEEGLSVLVGSDFYWAIVTGKQRRISSCLRAIETIFGWTIQGPHISSGKDIVSNVNLCSSSIPSTNLNLPALSDSDISAFWSLESIGIRSEDDENHHQAEHLISSCIKRRGSRYEAALPWKDRPVYADNNRNQAIKRLLYLSTRLSRIPDRFEEYNSAIRQMVLDGIAEPAPTDSCDVSNRVFYLPHRPVYKAESVTTKMRIVFDASSHSDDSPSLNDMLHVGANLLPDVLKILLNFRLGPIGIVADIEKAFLQILLSEKDRDSHRFLWLSPQNSSDKQSNFEELRMTRVTFGVNCSPFLLTATLRHHFAEERHRFQSTCNVLEDSFYMDDLIISVDTENEGQRICKEAFEIMKNAGMNLRKWNSNNSLIRESFASIKDTAMQKVLGLAWFIFSDEIAVLFTSLESLLTCNLSKATKRFVLQTIARIYNPLGMLAPTVIKLKILFQLIWKRRVSWDETIPSELLVEWNECVKSLLQLKDMTIPRSVISYSSPSKIHIHIFADASMKAYGTVAYLKNIGLKEECSVGFLCAKSRVAPLKKDGSKDLTLPKLELTAALIAARLCGYLKRSLKIPVERFYMWTDSRIALNWIQGEHDRWKPFVQSRVSEIRRHTLTSDWSHCSGKENPADLLTRGIAGECLLSSHLWAQGPVWLKDESYRNVYTNTDNIPTTVAPLGLLAETVSAASGLNPVLLYKDFSTWSRLLRVTCFIYRFVNNLKKNMRKKSFQLCAEELSTAEIYWIRYIQFNKFTNEVCLLQKSKSLPGSSSIAQLFPFLDNEGVMRLGGRLQSLQESMNFKHPIILPTKSHITDLIVRDCHQKCLHGGVNTVLSQLRARFWIPKGRQLVKKLLQRCVICKRLWGKPASQPFGALPIERLKLSRPFDAIGIDFAGPLYTFSNAAGSMSKAYLMVFTCAAIRAVHLEITTTMSTESCLMGLRRFIARSGIPSVIFSDNAQSFRRAALELKDNNFAFDDEQIQGFASARRINWKFIVERAPWWGGFWERLIRTIKNVLKVVIGKAKLNFEQLRTIIVEAEGMVNARPLTYISNDPLDLAPLTPGDFLTHRGGLFNLREAVTGSNEIQLLWKQRMRHVNILWKRWRSEYMQLLRSFHHGKYTSSNQLKKDDIVLVFDSGKPRIHWRLALIENAYTGRDGKVRACEIRYSDGSKTRRPIQLLYPLEIDSFPSVGGC